MDEITIEGVLLIDLKIIDHPKGNILHGMRNTDNGFHGFRDAYFSTINQGDIKGWKKHKTMIMNLIVPNGKVRFVLFDGRMNSVTKNQFYTVELSRSNYKRLMIPPGIWHAFKGESHKENIILNISNIKHDPRKILRKNIEEISYDWEIH